MIIWAITLTPHPGSNMLVYRDMWMLSCSVRSDSVQPYGQCSLPGSSVHGILQARLLEWVVTPFSRGSF